MKSSIVYFISGLALGALIMNWRVPQIKVVPSQSQAETVAKVPECQPAAQPGVVPVKKVEEKKTEAKTPTLSPESLMQELGKDNLFDTNFVTSHTDIDLSNFKVVQTLNQEEGSTTYLLENRDGMKLERTYDSEGNIREESWDDESGGKVERHYFSGGRYTHYTDPLGKRYEITYYDDGTILSKGVTGSDDSSKAFYYDRGGNVTGVWYSVPNKEQEKW